MKLNELITEMKRSDDDLLIDSRYAVGRIKKAHDDCKKLLRQIDDRDMSKSVKEACMHLEQALEALKPVEAEIRQSRMKP